MKVPKNELRNFNNFNLKNQIPVVYIKDDNIEKPIFYFAVSTGYFSDPKETAGLAHFLEHLIFMGSEKYPKENYFNDILAKYQGITNAYTDNDKTVYYFNCLSDGFEEIIDIFYNLIKNPLLSKSSQEREVEAVNSEHEKNILNDNWRFYRLLNILADNNHPLFKFGTGNNETLNNPSTMIQIKDFHKEFYHPSNFYICLGDKKDSKYYEGFLNKNFGNMEVTSTKNKYKLGLPYIQKPVNLYLPSEQNNKKLYLVWNMKRLEKSKNPIGLINEITTNMKVNSLQKILVNKDYIKSLGFSLDDEKDDYMIIIMVINLTDLGLENINEILSICISYLKFLNKQNVNSLIDEFKKKQLIKFNCNSNDNSMILGSKIIETMFKSLNEPLYFNFDNFELNENDYKKLTNNLLAEPNIILVASKDKFNLTGLKKLEKYNEKYYKMKYYDVNKFKINEIDIKFEIPKDNKYLLEPQLIYKPVIELVKEDNNYYRFDNYWKTPMVFSSILVEYPYFIDNQLAINQMLLVLAYQIKEYFYDALLLGYKISINPISSKEILNITVSGYNSKVNDITKELLEKLRSFDNLEKYINLVNLEYKQDLEKYKTSQPFSLVSELFKKSILPFFKTRKELLENYELLTINKFYNLVNKIINGKKNFYQYGNFDKKLVSKQTFIIKIHNNKTPLNIVIKHPNDKETNKSILISYNLGSYDIKTIGYIKLLNSLMAEDFFDVLRTQNQVGYLVKQYYSNINNQIYLIQHIQTQMDLDKVLNIIKEFNNNYIIQLSKTTDIELEKLKKNIIIDILKPYENMEQQYLEDMNEILTNKLLFNRKELVVEEIKKITVYQLVNFLKLVINKGKTFIVN